MQRYSNHFGRFPGSTSIITAVLVACLATSVNGWAQQTAQWPAGESSTWPAADTAARPTNDTAATGGILSNVDWLTASAGAAGRPALQPGEFEIPTTDPVLEPTEEEAGFLSEQLASLGQFRSHTTDRRQWQVAPQGLIYRSYLAGPKEPRLAAQWVHKANQGWIWDVTLGGRVGLVRYGTLDPSKPEGWEVDVEGAALGQLDLEAPSNALQATDYRVGVPLTYGSGNYQTKLGYYHISAHLGDELMIQQGVTRINYVRDAVVWGHSYFLTDDFRVYGEVGYSFNVDGGAEPWEFQFGMECSPDGPTGFRPKLFWATNAHLRQEVDYGGNITFQVGVQWRGVTGNRMRIGMQYLTGMSDQYEFFDRFVDKIGLAVWYDF